MRRFEDSGGSAGPNVGEPGGLWRRAGRSDPPPLGMRYGFVESLSLSCRREPFRIPCRPWFPSWQAYS